jgi:hypothetical protein
VILRAPILSDNAVNIGFHGTLVTNADANNNPSGGGVVVDAYATWSTTDACTNGACATVNAKNPFASLTQAQQDGLSRHFDGIIDPAGWFYYNGDTITRVDGLTKALDIFAPTTTAAIGGASVYQPHVNFFQTTLKNFVQSFNATADFSGAQLTVASPTGSATTAALPSSLVHMRPDMALINPDSGRNGGSITVASNWNLGAGAFNKQGIYVPYYRTGAGEAGYLTLRAANNIDVGVTDDGAGNKIFVNATISDGFYEQQDAFGGPNLVANRIDNNPQSASTVKQLLDTNTTAAASLMSIDPGVNNGSFSYDFVAGAAGIAGMPSANPNAVIPVASLPNATTCVTGSLCGDFTIAGHTTYLNSFSSSQPPMINIPTLVRTGTGSITVTAAGNFELLDKSTPGAIYTAGAAVTTPSGFSAPQLTAQYIATPNGLVGTPTWATGGGSVTIATGQSIIGIETPTDGPGGTHTGVAGGPMGQFWSDPYA